VNVISRCGDSEVSELESHRSALSKFEKKSRWTPALTVHRILWSGLFIALLCSGVPELLRQVRRERFGPVDSLHSIDRYVWGMNGAERAHQVVATLSSLPGDRRIVIFVRPDGESSMLGVAMSYLAWPHEVQVFTGDDQMAATRLTAITPDSVAAVIFCNVNAPGWFPAGVPCGRNVRIVCLLKAGTTP
jgi:hypothetical protein